MKPKSQPETTVPPQEPPSPALLSFTCLHCDHAWSEKRKPARCPACRSNRYWLPKASGGELPRLYFDSGANNYIMPLKSGDFLKLDATNAKLHLKRAGGDAGEMVGHLTQTENALVESQLERNVVYAGKLSGWKKGEGTLPGGERVLITSEVKLPVAKKGDWTWLQNILLQISDSVGVSGKRQYWTLINWMALARRSQLAGSFRASHALGFMGAGSDGKSFLGHIIKELLGGMDGASPLAYFTGDKENGYLAKTPLWLIDDKTAKTTFKERLELAANMKQACVVPVMSIKDLYRSTFVAPTFRRVVLFANHTAECVTVFPELTPDVRDKVLLCHSARASLYPTEPENQKALTECLPAFLYYLDRFETPEAMKKEGWCKCPMCHSVSPSEVGRFGSYSYHDTRLVALLSSVSADENLWAIIRQVLWSGKNADDAPETMTTEALEQVIDRTSFKDSKTRLTGWHGGFQSTLGKIAARNDGRITKGEQDGLTVWTCHKPKAKQ